ncbi:MAG: radical SAM protein [Myxococcales bacterium]|nr:radical SAM protein [Myxococcales bacterium]
MDPRLLGTGGRAPRVRVVSTRAPAGSYVVIETTNQCSLACVHCSVSEGGAHPHNQGVGFITPALFQHILDQLVVMGARFDTLIPFWLGEPLIHPEFGTLYRAGLRAASEGGVFQRVELHTNATHLGRDRLKIALNASPVPQTWHFSLDCATPERYLRIKGRDLFDTVETNLHGFLDESRRTGARWPRPVFQMIVGENNADQVEAFAARWTAACALRQRPVRLAAQVVPPGEDAIIFFRQLDAPTPAAQQRANIAFRAGMSRLGLPLPKPAATPEALSASPGVCSCFWKSPVIGWDGRVTTCVRDNRFENLLGNVLDTPLAQLWWGERMRRGRAAASTGRYDGFAACHDCYIPRSSNYTDITPAEIAACA